MVIRLQEDKEEGQGLQAKEKILSVEFYPLEIDCGSRSRVWTGPSVIARRTGLSEKDGPVLKTELECVRQLRRAETRGEIITLGKCLRGQ